MSHRPTTALALSLLSLAVLLLSACSFGVSASEPNLPPVAAVDPIETADRSDCTAILGTAFRSAVEREWFQQNCGKWPPVQVPDAPVTNVAAVSPDVQAACDAQRGRPYANNDARNWYLQNCNNLPAAPSANTGGNNTASTGPDRANCDEIRGTTYRSAGEQRWYQENCGNNRQNDQQANNNQQNNRNDQPSGSSSVPTNPTVAACANIAARGGPRNAAERELYLRFCR